MAAKSAKHQISTVWQQRGVVFEKAYCAYPLCAPSRAAMMTGWLPLKIGAYDNGAEFRASIQRFI